MWLKRQLLSCPEGGDREPHDGTDRAPGLFHHILHLGHGTNLQEKTPEPQERDIQKMFFLDPKHRGPGKNQTREDLSFEVNPREKQ